MVRSITEMVYQCDCGNRHRTFEAADACGKCVDCKQYSLNTHHQYQYSDQEGERLLWAKRCEACDEIYRATNRKRWADERRERLAKAVEISAEELGDNMIYVEGDTDTWHVDLEDAADKYYGEDNRPEFGYATTKITLTLDAETILTHALESEFDEDAMDRVCDMEGLQAFLDKWCESENITSYYADFSRKIRIPELDRDDHQMEPSNNDH